MGHSQASPRLNAGRGRFRPAVLSDELENVVVRYDEFFQEIAAHPIPTDLDAVRSAYCCGAPRPDMFSPMN
jgi:hypothetical protein